MRKQKVLFLCTGNSARSQMAEAFLRHYADSKYEAHSAGLDPQGINTLTKIVMEEAGISMVGQYSKHIKDYLGRENFSYLITVCAGAEENCPSTFPGISQRISWHFDDPAAAIGSEEEKLNKFRQVRDQIEKQVKLWISNEKLIKIALNFNMI